MSENLVMIPVEDMFLEARHAKGNGPEVAVLCHPHPLYGGNMENSVVLVLAEVFQSCGWGTLRFNFRGVGRSGGRYGSGDGEVEDLLAVGSFLSQQSRQPLLFAGYSFGAWIVLKAIRREPCEGSVILVSPPLDFLDFTGLELPPKPCLITLGDKDTFCTTQSLEKWLAGAPFSGKDVEVHSLADCDHFYRGHERALAGRVRDFLQDRLQAGFNGTSSERNHERER